MNEPLQRTIPHSSLGLMRRCPTQPLRFCRQLKYFSEDNFAQKTHRQFGIWKQYPGGCTTAIKSVPYTESMRTISNIPQLARPFRESGSGGISLPVRPAQTGDVRNVPCWFSGKRHLWIHPHKNILGNINVAELRSCQCCDQVCDTSTKCEGRAWRSRVFERFFPENDRGAYAIFPFDAIPSLYLFFSAQYRELRLQWLTPTVTIFGPKKGLLILKIIGYCDNRLQWHFFQSPPVHSGFREGGTKSNFVFANFLISWDVDSKHGKKNFETLFHKFS